MNRTTVLLLLVLATAIGCRKETKPPQPDALNEPASRAQALVLMSTVEQEGIDHDWPPNVARQVRHGMLNRLMNAGLTQEEVEKWIAASDDPYNRTENSEGE